MLLSLKYQKNQFALAKSISGSLLFSGIDEHEKLKVNNKKTPITLNFDITMRPKIKQYA